MLSKGLLSLATLEALSPARVERQPETNRAFDSDFETLRQTEDTADRALQGLYHFCALATSRLIPEGGLVLDLGTGAGSFPIYLAQRRPDITILGVDSDERLVELAQDRVTLAGLQDRISINVGELTNISERVPGVDMVTCVLGLHTLPRNDDLFKCLQEMSLIRIRCGCAVWMFDFNRPNQPKTVEEFPGQFSPGSLLPFKRNLKNAIQASFNYREMSDALGKVTFGMVHHAVSGGLKIFQTHWIEREEQLVKLEQLWDEPRLPAPAIQQFRELCGMFPKVPLPKHLK